MRNTRKILVALLVLMSILMSLAVVAIPASAEAATTLYLTPNANWKQDGARFAAYFFGNGEKWVSMTDSDKDGIYEVDVPAGYPNVIFCRMNPNASANNWNNKYNQTADLVIPTSGANHYTVKEGTWDKGGGTWSTYGSTCAHANLGPAATCTTSQDCLDCGDPVVSALGHTYNSAHLCTRCNGQATFTVAGSGAHLGTEWDTGNTANDMTYADGVYTKVYTNVAAGSYKLKVARDHDWGTAYPSADKAYTVATAGSTVTVTLKGTTVDITVEAPHTCSFSDATCTEPQKCECGKTQGEALGHDYVEGVCSRCEAVDPEYTPEEKPEETVKPIVNISDLAEGTTTDGELIAGTGISASEGLAIDANNKSIDGFDFTLRLKLGGTMKVEEGVVKAGIEIKTNGAAKIVVYAISSSSSDSTRTLQLATLVDGALVKLAETAGVDGAAIAKYELSVDAAGTYYLGSTKSGINLYYIAVEEVEAPAHVNTLVVGDTNKIVVSGNILNAYQLPIEWVAFVADEKAHYEFIGDNGALAMIFSADGTSLLCGGTGKADLEAGTYLICVGNGVVGEFNVAVTKTAIEEPVAPKYEWWVSDGSLYVVEGDNIKYNGAGNTYACVGCDVTALAAGNNTFTITITNNGSAIAKVRVDLQATVQVGNHKVVNVSAVGGDVWTDAEWGGSHVNVAPGESVTLVITYDENTERGAVKDLIIFADSSRGDEAVYSADITVSGMAFSKVSDDEPVDYTNTLVVGDNNVVIGHKAVDNGYGYLMETVIFTADEKAHYKFAGAGLTVLVYDMAFNNLCAFTGEADLDAGMYIICFAANTIGTTGEYSLSVTKSAISDEPVVEPELPAIVLGDNAVVIDGSQTNLVGKAVAWYTFTPEVAGTYKFACTDLTVYILTSQNMADLNAYVGADGVAELETGVQYFVLVGKDGVTGEFTLNISDGAAPVHKNTIVVGDNHYIISDTLHGIGYEFLAVEITEPGTYVITGGAPMQVYFFTVPGTLNESSPHKVNIDGVSLEFVDSFEVTLTEAGTYWIGFRYDHVGDEREFDINISLKPASEQPDETPDEQPDEQPEQPAPELSLFEKIMQTINEFIAKITAWFKSFIAGLKK